MRNSYDSGMNYFKQLQERIKEDGDKTLIEQFSGIMIELEGIGPKIKERKQRKNDRGWCDPDPKLESEKESIGARMAKEYNAQVANRQ